jgi:hypothetical protein
MNRFNRFVDLAEANRARAERRRQEKNRKRFGILMALAVVAAAVHSKKDD